MMSLDTQLAQLHEMMPSSSTLPPCIVFSVASGLPAILLSICNFYHLINFNFPFTKTFLIVFIKSLQHSIDLDRQDATSNISRDHCQFTFASARYCQPGLDRTASTSKMRNSNNVLCIV